MKNSIIYLGIALVSFANANSSTTNNLITTQQSYLQIENSATIVENNSLIDNKKNTLNNDNQITKKTVFIPVVENDILSNTPGDLIYIEKSIDDIIAADNEIIDYKIEKVVRPIYIEDFIESTIIEDNKIIESNILNISYPLDFDVINKTQIVTIENKVNWVD